MKAMKRTHLFAVLIGMIAMGIFAADASAMYHPGMGRFMQRDPGAGNQHRIGAAGVAAPTNNFIPRDPTGSDQYADGMSLYQYVGSRPIRWVDPLGRVSVLPDEYPWNFLFPDYPYFVPPSHGDPLPASATAPAGSAAGRGTWGKGGYQVGYEWKVAAMTAAQVKKAGLARYSVLTQVKVTKGPKCPCKKLLWITWGAVYVSGKPYTPPGGKWPWVGIDRYMGEGSGSRSDDEPYTFSEAEQVKVNEGHAYTDRIRGMYTTSTDVTLPQSQPASRPSTSTAPAMHPADSIFVDAAGTNVKDNWDHRLVTCLLCRKPNGRDCKIGCLYWEWSPNKGSPAGIGRQPTAAELKKWEDAVKAKTQYIKNRYDGDCKP